MLILIRSQVASVVAAAGVGGCVLVPWFSTRPRDAVVFGRIRQQPRLHQQAGSSFVLGRDAD